MKSERVMLGVEVVGPETDVAVQGWRRFLQQEGVAFSHSPRATGCFPVVVVVPGAELAPVPAPAVQILDGFTAGPGPFLPVAVRCIRAGECAVRVCGVARVGGTPGPPMDGVPQLVPFADEQASDRRPGYPAWTLRGRRFVLPMCLGEQMALAGSGFHPYEGAEDEERVELLLSAVDHNGVGRMLQQLLRAAFRLRGLPYVRKWYYPELWRSVLLSRIDVDVVDPAGVRAILASAAGHRRRATFFVNSSGEEEVEDAVGPRHATDRVVRERATLEAVVSQGSEVAAHGWWHTVFPDQVSCLHDMRRSVETLRSLGLEPTGYGGPGGAWYPAVAEALDRLRLDYSSELGASFEGFPGWSPGAELHAPLHVAVSPLVQDHLARGRTPGAVLERWRSFLGRCVATGEPASFVLHTQDLAGDRRGLYDALLDAADQFGLGDMTFGELARWWRFRAAASLRAVWHGDDLDVAVDDGVAVLVDDEPPDQARVGTGVTVDA